MTSLMLKAWSRELDMLLQVVDVTGSALLFGSVAQAYSPDSSRVALDWAHSIPVAVTASLIWPATIRSLQLNRSKRTENIVEVAIELGLAGALSAFAVGAVSFFTGAPVPVQVPLLFGLLQTLVLGGMRVALHLGLRGLRRSGRNTRNVLIAGSGPRALYIEEVIRSHPAWGLQVIGFVDDEVPHGTASADAARVFPIAVVPDLLSDQVIDEFIIACPRSKLEQMVAVVDQATAAGVPTTLLSDLFGDLLPVPVVRRFGSLPALTFAPVHHSPAALGMKRILDVVGAGALLLITAPLLGAAALGIRLTDPGPVFFHQVRCTLNGRLFTMPKLRTMRVDAEALHSELAARNEMDGPVFKIQHDPRITPIGRFLRKFSLDELPQLWSVLRGDMSLVGPRPAIPHEVAAYKTFERRRLSMRPGITCLWQVSGRNQIGFDDWVRLDLEYIDTWSLGSDFRILLRTVPAVLSGEGAS